MESRSTARRDVIAGVRIAARLAGLAATLLSCLVGHGIWRMLRLSSPWPRWFLGICGRICGARRRDFGTPVRRDVVFLANHTSWLDILVLAGGTGTAFVAKGELAQVPLVGWLCGLNRTIFVARGDRTAIAGQIDALRDALRGGWPVTVFPEGTTSAADALLPFKGALLAVLEPPPPGVVVQPVFLDYGRAGEDVAWLGDEHGSSNALRVLGRRGSFAVDVHYLPPFDPSEHAGRKAIAQAARRQIERAMEAHSCSATPSRP